MSKKSKANSKQTRLNKKRAIRQANRNRYDVMRKAGENSKSVRFIRQNRHKKLVNKTSHVEGRCGNIGCTTCNTKHIVKKIKTVSLRKHNYMMSFISRLDKAKVYNTVKEFVFKEFELN
jgi:hypothetical protein